MKFNTSLKPIVISLFTLASLPTQNPAVALVTQEISQNYQTNSAFLSIKQPIQIAKNDEYWGPQRDFQIWMPGEVIENNKNQLMTTNTTNQTVYIIIHQDLPWDTYDFNSQQIRQILQTAMRENLDTKGKVVKSTNMVIEGYPGIELLIQHSDGTQGQYQGYIVRRRLYLLGARTSDELTTEAANFFDSFRVYPSRIVNSN
ncbi:hypothetical protein [Trichormus variabilis]|uniref:DUF1795 domain-containing protein n=1 Tax=Trichormus variabilis SAG 1403-4b TaxID=447716 RepID=A0A3S1IDB4_ANAVA|nr:hypothetical protein [Trichormus variabilis]MBD2626579.1 hypothetical protein [Trichormus variabilis FACHB-164]RUS95701.1 hypothetical protein DSM107003_28770 [Trichormus variabilis SAG 1403-4b]